MSVNIVAYTFCASCKPMKLIIILFFLLSCSLFCVEAGRRKRIYGGGTVKRIRDMPWNVYLRIEKVFMETIYCSGVIVSSTFLVTAGHCVCDYTRITFLAGTAGSYRFNFFPSSAWKKVRNRFIESKAANCHTTNPDDIATLETSESIRFSSRVQKIKIDLNEISGNTDAFYLGYGRDSAGDRGYLRFAYTKARKCPDKDMICAQSVDRSYLRRSDSGGPLVICPSGILDKDCRLIGIASNRSTDADVFVSIYRHRKLFKRFVN